MSICYFNNQKNGTFTNEKVVTICPLEPSFPTRLLFQAYRIWMTISRFRAGQPGRGRHTAPRGENTAVNHLRTWAAQQILALCSLGPPSGCRYLREERLYHSVFLLFPATSICAFHKAKSDGLLNFRSSWHKPLEWPGSEGGWRCLPGPPTQAPNLVCRCLLRVYPIQKVYGNSPQRGFLTCCLKKTANGFVESNWTGNKCEWEWHNLFNLLG